jgi:hypothetical protein
MKARNPKRIRVIDLRREIDDRESYRGAEVKLVNA